MASKNNSIMKIEDVRGLLSQDDVKKRLAMVAQKHMTIDRLTLLMISACSRIPKILECSKSSILQFCMKCSETGLEPIGAGGAWPIPYGKDLTFIPDYRGLINCAKRAGCIIDAEAQAVRENDEFSYRLGLHPDLVHVPARTERGELIGAYCIYTLPGGDKKFVHMDPEEILSIKTRSKAYKTGPWVTDEAEMWKKTVIRRAMKPFAGMNSALDSAIDADDKAFNVIDREPIPMPSSVAEDEDPRVDSGEGEAQNKSQDDDLPFFDEDGK